MGQNAQNLYMGLFLLWEKQGLSFPPKRGCRPGRLAVPQDRRVPILVRETPFWRGQGEGQALRTEMAISLQKNPGLGSLKSSQYLSTTWLDRRLVRGAARPRAP